MEKFLVIFCNVNARVEIPIVNSDDPRLSGAERYSSLGVVLLVISISPSVMLNPRLLAMVVGTEKKNGSIRKIRPGWLVVRDVFDPLA